MEYRRENYKCERYRASIYLRNCAIVRKKKSAPAKVLRLHVPLYFSFFYSVKSFYIKINSQVLS